MVTGVKSNAGFLLGSGNMMEQQLIWSTHKKTWGDKKTSVCGLDKSLKALLLSVLMNNRSWLAFLSEILFLFPRCLSVGLTATLSQRNARG